MPSTMAKRPQPVSEWPARLKRLRERRGLTQAEAAKLVRISQSQWSSYESGKQQPTRPIAFLLELLEKGEI